MEEQQNEYTGISYKVNCRKSYKINATTYEGKTFYNIPLVQKKYNGGDETFNRRVNFSKCDPPEDGQFIRILSGFESDYQNPRDKYNWIPVIIITAYEIAEDPKIEAEKAIEEFKQQVEQTDDIIVTADDLPF